MIRFPPQHLPGLVFISVVCTAEVHEEAPLQDLIAGQPWTSWGPAELVGTIQYVRGCKNLGCPSEFRSLFPSTIGEMDDPVAVRMEDTG